MDKHYLSAAILLAGNELIAYHPINSAWRIRTSGGAFIEGANSEERLKEHRNYILVEVIWEKQSDGMEWPVRFEVASLERYELIADRNSLPSKTLKQLTREQVQHVLLQLVDEFPKFWFEKTPSLELRKSVEDLRRRAKPSFFSRLRGS